MLVQPRRDKAPDLMQDDRDGQKQRDHQRQLERREERRGHPGGDHRRAFRQVGAQRRGDQRVDVLGEIEQPGEQRRARLPTMRSRRVRSSVRWETRGIS